MFHHNYASSTVTTYISALGYFHKLYGHDDPSRNFFISQMMKGYSKIDSRVDSCFPITLPLLHRIVAASSSLAEPHYNIVLFQAMCLFAFHTFTRTGEITQSLSNHNLQFHQLSQVKHSGGNVVCFKITFHNYYKHSIQSMAFYP